VPPALAATAAAGALRRSEGETKSERELADVTGEHLSKVSYHVRVLAENKAVRRVGTKPRRESVEHFYRATRLVDEVPWGREALGLPETG